MCTPESLVLLEPLRTMRGTDRSLVGSWLEHHGIDATSLAPGSAVQCDRARYLLRWVALDGSGAEVRRLRHHFADDGLVWPRPFPEAMLTPGAFTDPDGYVLAPGLPVPGPPEPGSEVAGASGPRCPSDV
ncbi:hypothetical protein [Nocardioides litoris]|uniref:hypothetical protein n=1 Tax=Nocardioides litoris TaxID=1926648 RepID=UPI00111E74C5|nr:hypothetical protein [Nocardioides litoris]